MPQALPNLHHLELFYHVARAGGISAAVRSMPYGIQQPAVSSQIAQLEEALGTRLFRRRPFQLTEAGKQLDAFCAPFFGGLGRVAEHISGVASRHLRVAAPAAIMRDHLPAVMESVRQSHPDLELSLWDTGQKQALDLLEREEVDLAITELDGKPPAGTQCEILLSLPLVIFLPADARIPKGGLRALSETYPLIRPSFDLPIGRLLLKSLNSLKINWASSIEIGTLDSIIAYCAHGFGVGVGVEVPGRKLPATLKSYQPDGFPKLKVAALWKGSLCPLAEDVLSEVRKRAARM